MKTELSKNQEHIQQSPAESGEIILYQPNENIKIEVKLDSEMDTVWLSQAQMAELFQKDQSNIARHIKNVFDEGELPENSNMQILHNTLSKFKPTKVYSLNVSERDGSCLVKIFNTIRTVPLHYYSYLRSVISKKNFFYPNYLAITENIITFAVLLKSKFT